MKTFVTTHGEKILAAVIVIPCLWWMLLSGDELFFKSPASDSKMVKDLGTVRGALTAANPDLSDYRYDQEVPHYESLAELHLQAAVGSGDTFRYDDDVDSFPWADPPADFQPAEHMFYGRPPEGVKKGRHPDAGPETQYKEVFASILPPTDVSAQPRLGQVVITWQEGATNLWGGVQEFLVFRRDVKEVAKVDEDEWRTKPPEVVAADPPEGGEKDWPAKPIGIVAADPPGPGAFSKMNFGKLKLARYSYSDNNVEPQKKYTYRVRTRGVQASDKQIGKIKYLVRVEENLEQNPQTDEAGKVVRIELMTAFTEPIEVMAQSDISIVFQVDAYVDRRRVATFLVMRWNVEKSDWTKATARNIPRGQPIIGRSKRARKDVEINSGYIFVNIEVDTRTEEGTRTVFKPDKEGRFRPVEEKYTQTKRVKMAIVEEVFSGKMYKVDQGKTLGAAEATGTKTPPDKTKPRRGGRRGGRRAP